MIADARSFFVISDFMESGPKQDPTEKVKRALAADGRCYFSYAQIATAVSRCVPEVEAFAPDVFVAIGGGGFIPARMLRTEVKKPILAISLELYDDATKTANASVLRKQWFDETPGTFGALVRGKRVLIIDEVDDTRATLQYAVEELKKTNNPAAVGVLVVHNKLKPKKGTLPDDVTYIAGEHVPNAWNCYPWDAPAYGRDINAHEALARECMGERVYGFADMCKAALAGAAVMVVFLVAMKVGITPLHGRAEFN